MHPIKALMAYESSSQRNFKDATAPVTAAGIAGGGEWCKEFERDMDEVKPKRSNQRKYLDKKSYKSWNVAEIGVFLECTVITHYAAIKRVEPLKLESACWKETCLDLLLLNHEKRDLSVGATNSARLSNSLVSKEQLSSHLEMVNVCSDFLFLPACYSSVDKKYQNRLHIGRKYGAFVSKNPTLVLSLSLAVPILLCIGLVHFRVETKPKKALAVSRVMVA